MEVTSAGEQTGLAPEGAYYFAKDGLGSIVDIHNSAGAVVQHYAYSSFGKILKITNGGVDNYHMTNTVSQRESTISEKSILEVFPYRNTAIQIIFVSLLFIPTCLFIMYAPFQDPCSPDRMSGDCSLGSPFLEQIYKFSFVSLGIIGILAVLYIIRRYYLSKIPKKGCRVAFTCDSIIGPIWGVWSSLEGEIKFNEITDFSIVQSRYGVFIQVNSIDKKMMLKNTFLINDDSFKRVFNRISEALGKPNLEKK